jgi:hypothetical protein
MKPSTLTAIMAGIVLTVAATGSAQAARRVCDDGSFPPCNKPPGESSGTNNLSYPVILSEGVTPGGFPVAGDWVFADITDPASQCTTGVEPGTPVSPGVVCYWNGSQVWWLSQRQSSSVVPDGNFWKVFSTGDPNTDTPVVVTAIDWGDLLESGRVTARRVRTEVTLYKDATGGVDGDADFAQYLATNFGGTCELGTSPAAPDNCFAAANMSGAVPGTEQSINEIQGTDYGVDTETEAKSHSSATGMLVDPTTVHFAETANDGSGSPADVTLPLGFDTTVYSRCARLIIQRIIGDPSAMTWDATNHYWSLGQASAPVVDIRAWDDTYTTEINASGTAIYGFNWDAQGEPTGTYRMTFLLDKESCNTPNNTEFTAASLVANPGELSTARIIPTEDPRLDGDTAGLSYVDVEVQARGGGGTRGGNR